MKIAGLFKSFFQTKTDVFARFEILREAISGTMSRFYKVRDRQTREVFGLKILDKEQTAALQKRLGGVKRPPEGEIATALDHPRIVKTFEHGVTTKDEQFLLMEFLEGPGLNSLLIGKGSELEAARLPFIRQAAEAIAVVHEAGFIHRDVCPRNFVADKEIRSLKLIDFGLTLPNQPEFRRPGNRTGTPAYMSPEVVRRKGTDHRLDIFSFGVMAYELCTYHLPWKGGVDGKAALAHDSVAPTPIEERRPTIDPKLAAAIMKCIRIDPAERFATMREFISAIAAVRSVDATAGG